MGVHIITKEKNLGTFGVRRALPVAQCRAVGPFVFFDHMGPVDFEPGDGLTVRPHPHINLATLTYLFEGEIVHRDSLGTLQPIMAGDLNLMVAGRGIVHSEREAPEQRSRAHRLHGLQLWLGLPERVEEQEPKFFHYPKPAIPSLSIQGASITVLMGTAYGVTSPVVTYAPTLCMDARLETEQPLTLPTVVERAIYVVSGAVAVGGRIVQEGSMLVLEESDSDVVASACPSHVVLVGGAPLGHRYLEWNFVSSDRQRIELAKQAWRDGDFPSIPDDNEEFIPLPE